MSVTDPASPGKARQIACPYCRSSDNELFSLFGQTLIGSQYYCHSCRTVFEAVRWDDPQDEQLFEEREAGREAISLSLTPRHFLLEKRMELHTLLYNLDDDGIALVTLNRPDVLNAVNLAMRHDFTALMEELFFNTAVKVVIFTGAGRGFSAGGDMAHFEHDWLTPEFRANSRRLVKFFDDLEALEKPVIVAINGPTTGAGLELALASDIRIASDKATLGFRENYIGLIPGVGGCARLIRTIGLHRAKELIWLGAMYSADEAMAMGLLNKIVPHDNLLKEAFVYAHTLLKRAPQAIGMAKKLLNTIANMDQTSGIAVEGLAQSILIKTEDHEEGVQAFREKRKPIYKGR